MSYSQREVCRMAGIGRGTLHSHIVRAKTCGVVVYDPDGHVSEEFISYLRDHCKVWGQHSTESSVDTTVDLTGRPESPTYDTTQSPTIVGLTPASRQPDPDELWARVIAHQRRTEAKTDLRYNQRIELPGNKPVLLALMADTHFGNAATDYSMARTDAETVRETPGCYALLGGDHIDNWVAFSSQHVQREQVIRHTEELALLESWLKIMGERVVCAVAGNHELRSYELAGIDILQRMLCNAKVLFDQHEVRALFTLGDAAWRFKIRHMFKGGSKLNPSAAIENDARYNDGCWDVAIACHTHAPTICRQFYDHVHDRRVKYAIQLGSFEMESTYGRELNLPRSVPCGSAGLMLFPTGELQFWSSLQRAAEYVTYLRGRQ